MTTRPLSTRFRWPALSDLGTALPDVIRALNQRVPALQRAIDAAIVELDGTVTTLLNAINGLTDVVENLGNFPDGATTPDVSTAKSWLCQNTSPTTITGFTGGRTGQTIVVMERLAGANTTIHHSTAAGGIITKSGADIVMGNADTRLFVCELGSRFREV